MVRHQTIDTETAVATADPVHTGPLDPREVVFADALTGSRDTQTARLIAKAGELFLVASAGFVVIAAIAASVF
ncbi:MAG: hypothetical protein AAGC57_01330 [Pseudomonadota bacterium]